MGKLPPTSRRTKPLRQRQKRTILLTFIVILFSCTFHYRIGSGQQ
jgi:hypothetical protein